MKSATEKANLTEGSVWRKLLIFFLPIAAGTIIQQLYNAVDGLIVGRFVGTEALAAVGGSAAQIINVLVGFFVAMTAGASVIIGQIYGAGRKDDLNRAIGTSVTVMALFGLGLMLAGIAASEALLRLLNTPDDTLEFAVLYLRIYFLGVPFLMVLNMESSILRAMGDSFHPFLYMVVGCVLNIVLDTVFVVALEWKSVAAVAVATVAAQAVNTALLTQRLTRRDQEVRLSLRDLGIKGVYLTNMLRLGIPAGLQSSMYSVSNMIIQVAVNSLGTVVVASWAMSGKTDGFYWAISNAIGAAITSFIAQNYGAGRTDRVRQCVKQGMIMHFAVTLAVSGLLMLTAKPMLRLLTPDEAVVDKTYEIMAYFVPYYFTWVLVEVLSAVLRGAGDAVWPVVIIGIGICLFRVIWVVTVFAHFGTLLSLCLSYTVSWTITSAALVIYYKKGRWINRRRLVDR